MIEALVVGGGTSW
jgi:hypothetical protein